MVSNWSRITHLKSQSLSSSPVLILLLAHKCLVLISDDPESIVPVAKK